MRTLSLATEFVSSAARWEGEAERGLVRSTLWYGIVARACGQTENLIRSSSLAVETLVPVPSERRIPGRDLTMGDCKRYLEASNRAAAREASSVYPELSGVGKLLNRIELAGIDRLLRIRNDSAHGRLDFVRHIEVLSDLFQSGRMLCNSNLVLVAVAVEGGSVADVKCALAEAERSPIDRSQALRTSFEAMKQYLEIAFR